MLTVNFSRPPPRHFQTLCSVSAPQQHPSRSRFASGAGSLPAPLPQPVLPSPRAYTGCSKSAYGTACPPSARSRPRARRKTDSAGNGVVRTTSPGVPCLARGSRSFPLPLVPTIQRLAWDRFHGTRIIPALHNRTLCGANEPGLDLKGAVIPRVSVPAAYSLPASAGRRGVQDCSQKRP